ncbi:MAG TPA: glycosyltransferase family 87 protein [Candidatus Sulfotelmatobacter sp.]|jgi:hypothetical protein|nr:glycosyltransferase family 87 protein [Candidatus Sulfotelmatobacter sp.]
MTKSAAWRDGRIFTPERVLLYSLAVIAVYLALVAGWLATFPRLGLTDSQGMPLGGDFLGFWSASWIGLHRPYPDLYNNDVLRGVEAQILKTDGSNYFCWLYPPMAGVLVWPLALLPYGASFVVWAGTQLAAVLLVLRRIVGHRLVYPAALAFAPLALNIFAGQNASISTALLGGGLLLLPRRPLLAGVLFASLCYKPHLGLLIPVALLAARQWRAMAGGVLGGTLFGGASLLLAGIDGWAAFLAHGDYARTILEQGGVTWGKMASVYASLRSFGLPDGFAWAGQGVMTFGVAALVARIWASDCRYALKAAVLAAGVPLATPFVLTYDLMPVGLAIAWMVADGFDFGFQPWDKVVLMALWLAPLITLPLGLTTDIGLAPLAVLPLLVLIVRRWRGPRLLMAAA